MDQPTQELHLGIRPPDLPVLWSSPSRAEQTGAARCRRCSWESKSGCPSDDFGGPRVRSRVRRGTVIAGRPGRV